MMKTNSLQKALAILLSILLAAPLFVLPTFAEGEEFTELANYSSSCKTAGEQWIDRYELANATGTDAYKSASFYLSADGNTLKIVYTANDETVTELRTRDTDATYFNYLHTLPAFGDPLPTSAEGLEDGAYWFDLDGFIALLDSTGNLTDASRAIYQAATIRMSTDGTMVRMATHPVQGSDYTSYMDDFFDEPSILCGFLKQIGVDPNAGYTLLPTSDEGLEDGDYWFDLTSFLALIKDESTRQIYASAQYYLSDDGNTLRITLGTVLDFSRDDEDGASFFNYVRQVGVDPNAGFTLLPTSEDGLNDGDYWFDASGFAAIQNSEELQTQAQYYLSDDGNTIRLITPSLGQLDIARDSDTGSLVFPYLRQVGVDPNAIPGFLQLPTSEDGLPDGAYWFDAAELAEVIGNEDYLTYLYYLSDDGNTLRIKIGTYTFDIAKDDENASTYFAYLRQVGVNPNPGFTLLPKSPDGLADGDYWYDAAGFAAMANDDSYLRWMYYLSEDGNTLRIMMSGYSTDITKNSSAAVSYFVYLHKVGESYTVLPTSADGLEDGAYWFDAAGLAAMTQDDSFLNATYSLRDDGEILSILSDGVTHYYMNVSEYTLFFQFLRQAGVDPNAGFTVLPTSEEGLAFGDWWYDEAGLAAQEEITGDELQAFLDALVCYLSEDGETLRIIYDGYVMDYPVDDVSSAEFVVFLKKATQGYTLLPTSDEGLQDGDYWYDLENLNNIADDEFDGAQVYLSEDGETLRFVMGDEHFNSTRDDEDGATLFAFLRQVGVDPNAGYTLLPTSSDGLNVGDLWFDAAGLAELEDDDVFLQADFYLGEDGRTLRIFFSGYPLDVAPEDEDYADVIAFLHRITDPDTAYVTLTATTKPVSAGETVVVTVDLTQNPGLAGMMLSLQYDTDVMTLTDAEAVGMMAQGNLMPGGDLTAVPFNILWDDATAPENHTETGTILKLTFKVKQTAVDGTTAVTMTYDPDSTFDTDLQNVPATIYGTSIKIVHHLPGDVDGDGEVTLMDVTVLTRYLAGGWDVTIDEGNCDVNGDGILDLKDVVLIRRFLAGGWNVELV